MKVIYKKTIDLTNNEIKEICTVFETVFSGEKKSVNNYKNEFLNTCLGYSWQGLLLTDDDKIVGANVFVPFKYIIGGDEKLVAMSCDTMIMEQYRNFDNILNLITIGRNLLCENGFYMYIGFPNDNSYPLYKKAFRDKELGNLSIYALPYKIGGIKKQLKVFNCFSMLVAKTILLFSQVSRSKKTYSKFILRERKSFEETRYNWFNPADYHIVNKDKFIDREINIWYHKMNSGFIFDNYYCYY